MSLEAFDLMMVELRRKRKRLVVVGDAMWDHWIHGRVEECQDGCPKLVEDSEYIVPGGAANAARSLEHWGVDVDLFTYPVDLWPSKKRMVDGGGRIVFRLDNEVALRASMDEWLRTGHRRDAGSAIEAVCGADAVLLSDYDKGYLTPELIRRVAGLCKDAGKPCVADCKRAPEVYAGCILKCNFLYSVKWGHQAEVITNGDKVPFVCGQEVGANLPPVMCVNHVGAGDCFAAHMVLGLACGLSLEDAAAVAHSAGRVYVQRPHNCPPRPADIRADMAARGHRIAQAGSGRSKAAPG